MTPNVKRWLRRQAVNELKEAEKEFAETQRMHDLYASRNRGEDGYQAGIWYQEAEIATCLKQQLPELEFLRAVVDELSESESQDQHPKVERCTGCGEPLVGTDIGFECKPCERYWSMAFPPSRLGRMV